MTSPATSLPVAQWLERPTGVTRGHGFDSRRGLPGIPVGDFIKNKDVDQLFQPRSHLCNICGQSKPPKHILLSYGVKTLSENVELIQILNRLGHSVSFSQLEKNDTALCLQKMAANLNQKVVHPGTIQPNVFHNLAWDNIDRSEEALAGEGTTYRVNGIAL